MAHGWTSPALDPELCVVYASGSSSDQAGQKSLDGDLLTS